MDEIYPRLYLSPQIREEDHEAMERHGIESVVKLTYWEADDAYPEGIELFEYPMVDSPRHRRETFVDAVLTTIDLLDRGDRTLVHCKAGLSRSPAVATTAIGLMEGIDFDDALARVRDRTAVSMHSALEASGRSVLAELSATAEGTELETD